MRQNKEDIEHFGYMTYYASPHITRELINRLTVDQFIILMVTPFVIRVDVSTLKYIFEIWEGIKVKRPERVLYLYLSSKPARETYGAFFIDPSIFITGPRQ